MKKLLKQFKNIRMKTKTNLVTSLYVHIPFCESICDYCDFAKLQYFHNLADKYLDALENQLHKEVTNHNLKTIYIGGGTPTVLSFDQLDRLLKMLEPFSKNVEEYTIETNPETLDLSKIKLLKQYHINRVSIGVESTENEILKMINRKHSFEDVKKLISHLKEAGIDNINVDLIIGLPNVSEKMLEKDIHNILSLNPSHISCYSLTVHEHTVFYLNKIEEPSEDFAYNAYKKINDILENSGYSHYEVSNWALPNKESKHNLVYWNNEYYYGIGLASSGYLPRRRYKNTTNFNDYITNKNDKEVEEVSLDDEKEYQIMLNLRTKFGLDLFSFFEKYGYDLYLAKKDIIDLYIKDHYLSLVDNRLIATFSGMMILDKIIIDLY